MARNYSRARRNILLTTAALSTSLLLLFIFQNRQTAAAQLPWSYTNLYGHSPPTADYEEQDICKAHGYHQFQHPDGEDGKRKVFDLFLLSSEPDWLEIRLNTLEPYVDYFVVVEPATTSTGVSKPTNWTRFAEFEDRIVHKVVDIPISEVGDNLQEREDYLRNSLFYNAFPMEQAREGVDVVMVSNVEELPRPEIVDVLKHCQFPERLTMQSRFYYYGFQWEHIGPKWPHPQATTFRGREGTIAPNFLRNGLGGSWWQRWWESGTLRNAGWYCSTCYSTIEGIKEMMASFSDTPWNTETNRNSKTIVSRVRKGLDLFGRMEEKYARVEENKDVPEYIVHRPDAFGYLLDRDGEFAGFKDLRAKGA